MDKVIKIVSGIFIVLFVFFAITGLYGAFVEREYHRSLVSTYSYTLTISTTGELRNATLFVPVPENPGGSSPFIEQYSTGSFAEIPAGWEISLLGSNKATMLKIQAPVLDATGGIALSSEEKSATAIDTRLPQQDDIVLRPVQNLRETDCSGIGGAAAGATCYRYESAVYADYDSSPDAKVEISSSISGKNAWKIFGPAYNEYTNTISLTMLGDNHGWVVAKGGIAAGIGSYDVPGT